MQERVLIFNTGSSDAPQREDELNALLASGYRILEQREMAPGTVWLRLSTEAQAPAMTGAAAPAFDAPSKDVLPERRGRTLAIVLALSLAKVLLVVVTVRDLDDNDVMLPFAMEAIVSLAVVVAWRSFSHAGIIGSPDLQTAMNLGSERTLWRGVLGAVLLQIGVYVAGMIEISDLDEPATLLLMALVFLATFQVFKVRSVLNRLPGRGRDDG